MSIPPSSPFDVIVGLLATSLGDDAARQVVRRAAVAAGIENPSTRDEAMRVLVQIEKEGSTAGLAARLARSRLERGLRFAGSGFSGTFSSSVPDPPKSIRLDELSSTLARSLGDAKAEEAVQKAAAALGFAGPSVTVEQAVKLLESLVAQGGVVGTVARFAKVRFLLDK
ncbi:MAG: hypothetical protein JNK04_14305 [Myxococcales bacterium]|nr:hypothetical protein [Myxococcales bacterium]